MGPVPRTLVTWVAPFQIVKHFSKASATEAKSSSWCKAVGSPRSPTIFPFSAAALMLASTCVNAATGQGMFGVGGATGAGNAAKAGYHGIPGTFILAV